MKNSDMIKNEEKNGLLRTCLKSPNTSIQE